MTMPSVTTRTVRIPGPDRCNGDCADDGIPSGGERSANAVWTDEAPDDAVARIKDHVAFHPDRVDSIVITTKEIA